MEERKFNLMDEPWILVLDSSGSTKEVSLRNVLLNCQDYTDLAGEMETQNSAVLRLLLAILITVVSRTDENGEQNQIEEPEDAFRRWDQIWQEKRFPQDALNSYLDQWSGKFWLIDSESPFYQAESGKMGTEYRVSKLIGELSESSNKTKLFASRNGSGKKELALSEAARWLLYLIAYDDNSGKPKQKGAPAPGAGWLGQLGQVYARGQNLFETLALNMVLLKNGKDVWEESKPRWEIDHPETGERKKITQPQNLPALYTVNSRRVFLHVNEAGNVTGFSSLGGDFFEKEDFLTEQHTLWQIRQEKKSGPAHVYPKRHSASKQLWRDFSSLFLMEDSEKMIPGVVHWIHALTELGILEDIPVRFQTCAVLYGDSDYSPVDSIGDEITVRLSLMANRKWKIRIAEEIAKIDQAAELAGWFGMNTAQAIGISGKNDLSLWRSKGKEAFYLVINTPFQQWLASVNPQKDRLDDKMLDLEDIILAIMPEIETSVLRDVPAQAYIGRVGTEKKGDTAVKQVYSIPLARKKFRSGMYNLFTAKQGINTKENLKS